MASALNEESVEKKLKTVNNTQDSIQTLSLWIIHHKTHHERICHLWMKVLRKTIHPSHRLTLFYLCNDVIQTGKKKAPVYNTTFKSHLPEAACLVRDVSVKKKVERIFNIWAERNVYDASFVKILHKNLNGKSKSGKSSKPSVEVKKSPEEDAYNGPISPVASPYPPDSGTKGTSPEQPPVEQTEDDEEESARILAEFKPHEMIEQITAFTRQATDIRFGLSKITNNLTLDISSAEAVKRLKDRAHGNDFSNQFEDTCNKLTELVKRQKQHLDDQRLLLQTLNTSETFYEEQYREAKIVANAYKNFGARINNMKKKLDELKRTFPQPDSPVPSPDVNAPSPGNTPPHLGAEAGNKFGYNPPASQASGFNSAWYNGTSSGVGATQGDADMFNASPPLEAPSPEGSPPDLNLGNADSGVSLESRLASFFNQSQAAPTSAANPPVYTPQLPASLAAAKLSTKATRPISTAAVVEEDGSTTPLDDEAPTTPVQDEVSLSSPPPPPKSAQRNSTPPKKENPIDFLSRLISQTQKGAGGTTKTGAASFLDSLTMLSSGSAQKKVDPPGSVSSSQQPWSPWSPDSSSALTASSAATNNSSGSGAPATSVPTSPIQFPSSVPQPVPPPIPLPVPPPPMALNMNLNVPPPPPPPFLTSPVPPPDFSSPPPPPIFPQTSPGQKENWPDVKPVKPDISLIKSEPLPPPVGVKPVPRLVDPDAMEIVSDEDDASLGIDRGTAEPGGAAAGGTPGPDAGAEFANKLRQKTQAGPGPKSSVYVPDPERPNLMTLTSGEDVDDGDNMARDTLLDDGKPLKKSSALRKSRSRSRSKSREKERSHRHKKKKKHKRSNYSDDEDDYRLGEDGKSYAGVGSTVKKVSSRSSRDSRDSKGDKYDDDRRYDKYDDRDRKYDRYDDKPYRSEHKHHKSSSHRSSDGGPGGDKNTVEAYTQAYRNALMQQYSARFNPFGSGSGPLHPPGSDPRRYGKY